jgi:V/A-type H+/Na+-transporting ATPase subunit E
VSDLTALLEHEASAEIDAILAEARARAAAIVAQATAEAEADASTRERASVAQREALRVRALSAAQLEASALKLRAQHEAVEAVFDAAIARLDALARDTAAYEPVFSKLLAEAVAALGAEAPAEIVVPERDLKLGVAVAAKQGVTAPVVAGDLRSGARVRSSRGASVENSLHARLDALRDELASQVTKTLFGQTAAV